MVLGREPRGSLRRTSLTAAVALPVVLLGLLAARSDLVSAGPGSAAAALDVAVGWAFALAGLALVAVLGVLAPLTVAENGRSAGEGR